MSKNAFNYSYYHLLLSFLFMIIFFFSTSSSSYGAMAASDYNVVDLGARADGKTDSTRSFLDAWTAACASASPATLYVPPGNYLLNRAVFSGQCKNDVTFRIEGTLVAPSDYNTLGKAGGNWITFDDVAGVSILGGTLDGQGAALWACKAAGKGCPSGATSLELTNSKGIVISGLTSINSQMFHIVINGCENVKMQGVQVSAAGNSPNTDGIHVEKSTGVTITRAGIKTGDDCISVGPGTANLWIEGVFCGPGHGISIGSLGKEEGEQGVQNVTVKTVTFTGTENGVRIKTWARSSQGFVRGATFEDVIINNAQNPIIIDQNYCPNDNNCQSVQSSSSGVKISDVTYRDIKGNSASQVAVKFDCSSKNPCTGIVLDNVDLTYKNQPALSSCTSADGSASGLVHPSSCLA